MLLRNWNIEEETGYKPITTFYTDFSIADMFGKNAIEDTFKRAFNEWKTDYKYLTELVMVMSWKIFEHQENMEYAKLYTELYEKADSYAIKNLKGSELKYFYSTTD